MFRLVIGLAVIGVAIYLVRLIAQMNRDAKAEALLINAEKKLARHKIRDKVEKIETDMHKADMEKIAEEIEEIEKY